VRLALGTRTVDLATRSLVVATLDATRAPGDLCRQATALVGEGADVIELSASSAPRVAAAVAAVADALGGTDRAALGVATSDADVAAAAYAAGAVIGAQRGPGTDTVGFLQAAAAAGATVVLSPADPSPTGLVAITRAGAAAAIARDRLVVEVAATGADVRRVALFGYPVLVPVDPPTSHDEPLAATVAAATLAGIRGARLFRTTSVKAVRRTCDVLAAILEAP
jgi:dihydropteroate synthase